MSQSLTIEFPDAGRGNHFVRAGDRYEELTWDEVIGVVSAIVSRGPEAIEKYLRNAAEHHHYDLGVMGVQPNYGRPYKID